ncbi:MAG: glycosyltransferase family 4 protein [Synechococcaceae cyanobacterium]
MSFLHKVVDLLRRRPASTDPGGGQTLVTTKVQPETETNKPQPLSPTQLALESFDREYYAENNPDISADINDLFDHFMQQGWKEGRNPSAEFSTSFYLTRYPDVKQAGINPFVHWLVHGQQEGRQATPLDPTALQSIFNILPKKSISDLDRKRLQTLGIWWLSEGKDELVREAIAIDPEIGSFEQSRPTLYPPLYDKDYTFVQQALDRLRNAQYDCVILLPFGKLGGADLVGGILSRSLHLHRSTLIIRTDSSEWERPDWYHGDVLSLDFSTLFKEVHAKSRALYTILTCINPKHIFNVNSRLAFETFRDHGKHLVNSYQLHCYYFCSDLDQHGNERGYPVDFFRQVLPYLKTALIDSKYLMNKLMARYSLPAEEQEKLKLLYSPCSEIDQLTHTLPIVEQQIQTQATRERPRILWAGRLDKQKRFGLVVEIASQLNHVDFLVWGKAVLDEPPDMSQLPDNITIHQPFKSYDELPLSDADGWLYTSAWDGIPTILIEIGSLGMPIVASAVGGIPELISNDTGWLVNDIDHADSYVHQIHAMLRDPEERRRRASSLRDHIKCQHSQLSYNGNILSILN